MKFIMTISVQFIIVFICTVLSNLTDMQFLTNKLLVKEPLSPSEFYRRIMWDQDPCKFCLKEGTEKMRTKNNMSGNGNQIIFFSSLRIGLKICSIFVFQINGCKPAL